MNGMCDSPSMPKRSRMPKDLNQLAAAIVRAATDPSDAAEKPKKRRKDPAAVALGRKGGKKGGKARAASLTPERRSEIARKAASRRWAAREPS